MPKIYQPEELAHRCRGWEWVIHKTGLVCSRGLETRRTVEVLETHGRMRSHLALEKPCRCTETWWLWCWRWSLLLLVVMLLLWLELLCWVLCRQVLVWLYLAWHLAWSQLYWQQSTSSASQMGKIQRAGSCSSMLGSSPALRSSASRRMEAPLESRNSA